MIVISIPMGIAAAVYQNKWPDYLVRGVTFIGVSVPSFWLGLILLSIFGVQLRWVNVAGGTTDLKAMILPSVTLALAMSAKYTRQVRSAVLEETAPGLCNRCENAWNYGNSDFVETCAAKRDAAPCKHCWDFLWEVCLEERQWSRSFTTGLEWEAWR